MSATSAATLQRIIAFRITDPIVVGIVVLVSWYLRWDRLPDVQEGVVQVLTMVWVAIAFHLAGVYPVLATARLSRWLERLIYGMVLALVGLLVIAYAFQATASDLLSRTVVGSAFVASLVLLGVLRALAYRRMLIAHRAGLDLEAVILVGEPVHALSLSRHLKRHPELGLKPAAIVSGEIDEIADQTKTTLLNGSIDDLALLVDRHQATRVIICGALGDQRTILRCIELLAPTSVAIHYAPDYSSVPIFLFRSNDFAGRPVIDLSGSPWSDGDRTVKWIEDKVISATILVLISPILVVVAILIRLTSPGPVLFCQQRHGLHGRPITVYKFRTMHVNPPASVAKRYPTPLPEPSADEDSDTDLEPLFGGASLEPVFKQAEANDPRITRIGRFLRKTSIDEFPQFFNVLKGDMSIVGPRPHPIALNQQYARSVAELMRRHHVKPGITGLAQISGARGRTPNTQAMRDRLRYDLEYINSWSLGLDLKIILLTIFKGFYTHEP